MKDVYKRIYVPDHPRAERGSGMIYEHVLIAENKIGRYLTDKEVVHHIDMNKQNNSPDNLEIFRSIYDHSLYHSCLRYNTRYRKETDSNGSSFIIVEPNICICGNEHFNKKYCSHKCSQLYRRKVVRPAKDELVKLIMEKPIVDIALQFKVSDKSVHKWCKAYGIIKPGMGFWNKNNR